MTTIAYRDGIIAADRLGVTDGRRVGQYKKLRRMKDGRVAALVGDATSAGLILDWIAAGGKSTRRQQPRPEIPGGVVVFSAGSGARVYEWGGSYLVSSEFMAWGSGASLAIGAMAHGATAVEAAKIACDWDTQSGGPVDFMEARG